jgi:tetratricopeptide (TPR) repeat protein
MANINLRTYIKEIDDLIEEGQQIDEAIAHCRHILKSYPKHIDTYRLLGKSYLESKRYGDAGDLFQRVLSAIPNDFISHVGMAIIREDEGNLDAAIWHMERASEARPGKPAIEQELKRLIGKRDGIEPQRVRPTRGALARMYYHGGLFSYAISELSTTLEEDPDRPDLQLLLADSYWRTDKRVEAADLCRQILEKLPYCRDANRITAALLQASGRPKEAAVNLRRLIALDPYEAFVDNPIDDPDTIEASAVQLERLEWIPGQPMPSSDKGQPDWAASLGVDFRGEGSEAATTSEMPSWLRSQASPEQEQASGAEVELPNPIHPFAGAKPPVGAEIPDWMRDAGWVEGSGEATEGPMQFEASSPDLEGSGDNRPLEPAQLPSWLREINSEKRPLEEPIPESPPSQDIQEEKVLPEWIEEIGAPAGAVASSFEEGEMGEPESGDLQALPKAEEFEALLGEGQKADADIPDYPPWLEPSTPGATDTIVSWLGDKSMEDNASSSEDIPSWMRGTGPLDEVPPEEHPPEETEFPADIFAQDRQFVPESGVSSRKESPPAETPAEEEEFEDLISAAERLSEEEEAKVKESHPSKKAPEWLDEIADLEEELQTPEVVEPEEAPDWLTDRSAEDEIVPSMEESAEAPMWLSDAEEKDLQGTTPVPEKDEISPDWLSEVIGEDSSEFEEQEDAKPEWLEGFIEAEKSIQEEVPESEVPPGWLTEMSLVEEVDTSPRDEAEEPPEWLKGLSDTEKPDVSATIPEEEAPPDWVSEVTFSDEEVVESNESSEEETPEWLQKLSAASMEMSESTEGESEPAITQEGSPQEETPDWLQEFQEIPAKTEDKPEQVPEGIPQAIEAEALPPEEEIPEWLQDLGEVPTDSEGIPPAVEQEEPVEASMEEELVESDETPEWLQDLGEVPGEAEREVPEMLQEIPPERIPEATPLAEEPTTQIMEASLEEPPITPVEATTHEVPTEADQIIPAEEAPDWLQEISIEEASPVEGTIEAGDATEWLQEIEESEYEHFTIPEEEEQILEEEKQLLEEPVSDLGEPPDAFEEESVWQPEYAESEMRISEELELSEPEEIAIPEGEVEEHFDWLDQTAHEITAEPIAEPQPVEPVDTSQPAEELSTELETPMDDEEVFSFLEGLAARENGEAQVQEPYRETISEEPLQMEETEEAQLIEEHIIPEELDESLVWLEQLASEEPSDDLTPPIFMEETEAEIETEVPEWLEEVAEKPDRVPSEVPPPHLEQIPEEITPKVPQPELSSMEMIISKRFAEVMPEEEIIPEGTSDLAGYEAPEHVSTIPEETPELKVPETEPPVMAVPKVPTERESIPETAPPPVREPVPEASVKPAALSPQESLNQARSALGEGDIEGALSHYASLIEEKAELEAVIEDLRTAINRTPREPMLWQILGDALMKMGQLSDAIDAYRRGMETV